MNIQIAMDKYFDKIENYQKLAPLTQKLYKINLGSFIKEMGIKNVEDLNTTTLKNYVVKLREEDTKGGTKNSKLISVRNFLKFIKIENSLPNPDGKIEDLELFTDTTHIKELDIPSAEDIDNFLKPIKQRTGYNVDMPYQRLVALRSDAIVNLLYATGLRLEELMSIKRFSFDGAKPKETLSLRIIGKGSKVRNVYVNPKTVIVVKKYLSKRIDSSHNLFILLKSNNDTEGVELRRRTIQQIVYRRLDLCIKCGILKNGTRISVHTLRHAFATNMVSKGVDTRVIQKFMGHASIITTQRYAHVNEPVLEATYRKVFN